MWPSSTSSSSSTIANVELSWLATSKLRRTTSDRLAEDGRLRRHERRAGPSVRLRRYSPDPETFGEYRLTYRTGDIVSPRIEAAEPLYLEMADFCAAILCGSEPRSSTDVGVDVVRMIEAVDHSLARDGMRVEPAEVHRAGGVYA